MPLQLRSTHHDSILVLTLDAGGGGTAPLTAAVCAAGVEALNAAGRDVAAVVLAGLDRLRAQDGGEAAADNSRISSVGPTPPAGEGLQTWCDELRAFPRPVVAALDGRIAGAGCVLALACDLRVAAAGAVLDLAAHADDRPALAALASAAARHLGSAAALELLLRRACLAAPELRSHGLVTQPLAAAAPDAVSQALALAATTNGWRPADLARLKEAIAGGRQAPQW